MKESRGTLPYKVEIQEYRYCIAKILTFYLIIKLVVVVVVVVVVK